jgi:hypothetical protein
MRRRASRRRNYEIVAAKALRGGARPARTRRDATALNAIRRPARRAIVAGAVPAP